MISRLNAMHEAEMKNEFRQLYRAKGFDVCLQALYEIVKSGEWLGQVLVEEKQREHGHSV